MESRRRCAIHCAEVGAGVGAVAGDARAVAAQGRRHVRTTGRSIVLEGFRASKGARAADGGRED